jgi:hypothetical protein
MEIKKSSKVLLMGTYIDFKEQYWRSLTKNASK